VGPSRPVTYELPLRTPWCALYLYPSPLAAQMSHKVLVMLEAMAPELFAAAAEAVVGSRDTGEGSGEGTRSAFPSHPVPPIGLPHQLQSLLVCTPVDVDVCRITALCECLCVLCTAWGC
jgi:hypothetical protein